MAWLDDVKNLDKWLKEPVPDKQRQARARLVVLAATGLGSYAAGLLDAGGGVIAGEVTRYDSGDEWDSDPSPDGQDLHPFDPKGLAKVQLSITVATGAVVFGGTTFDNVVSIADHHLAAGSEVVGLGVMKHLTLSLIGFERFELTPD